MELISSDATYAAKEVLKFGILPFVGANIALLIIHTVKRVLIWD